MKCPICEIEDLYEIEIDGQKFYKCKQCLDDSDDYEINLYISNVKAFTEAIKDWI